MEKKVDIVVGIPSFNEADTIGFVAQTVSEGLATYFPDKKAIIINCDNNSPDQTKEAFLSAETVVPKVYISTEKGVVGKGNNMKNILDYVAASGAKTGIVVDADLKSIAPEWIQHLGQPVENGFDMVTPVYSRHQFDGTITNHLCYPLIFSLTGANLRQPIGGEFAFSRKLCMHWLKQDWTETIRQYGIDIFMTLHALLGGFSLCQTCLGTKVHKASAPKLGRMFQEVVYTLFMLLIKNRQLWFEHCMHMDEDTVNHFGETPDVPIFGMTSMPEPQDLEIDILKMKRDCREEYEQNLHLVNKYLSPYAKHRVETMFAMDFYTMEIMLWSQIVYTLLCSFEMGSETTRQEIISALKPLYFCRSLTFDYETWRYSVIYAEREVESQAMAFASQRSFLYGLYAKMQACRK